MNMGDTICYMDNMTQCMMTSSNGNTFYIISPLWGEFTEGLPSQKPVTRSFDVIFDLRLHEHLRKQLRRRCFRWSDIIQNAGQDLPRYQGALKKVSKKQDESRIIPKNADCVSPVNYARKREG